MVDLKHSIIGCHYDGYGVAITVAESSNKGDYRVIEEWYQLSPTTLFRVTDKCDEIFHDEVVKPERKVEIFINDSEFLKQGLLKMPSITRNSIKIASIKKDDAFTVISSLLVEEKISSAQQVLGLEKELKLFDPSATYPNHRVYALFNAVGQAEFNRITVPKRYYSAFGRCKPRGSHYSFFGSEWDD